MTKDQTTMNLGRDTNVSILLQRLVAAMAIAAFPIVLAGCFTGVCTAIGWQEGLTLTADFGEAIPDGEYSVGIEADGDLLSLTFGATAGTLTCPDGQQRRCIESIDVGSRTVHTVVDCGLPGELTIAVGYDTGGPEVAAITLSRDNTVISKETFTPTYSRDELNGPGCGVATQASAELSISP